MQRRMTAILAMVAVSVIAVTGCKKKEEPMTEPATTTAPAPPTQTPATTAMGTPAPSETGLTGEALFKQYCAACHPNGGNTINPNKTLKVSSMAAHKITTPEDIVKVMRNPGPGMTKFDEATISDADAKKIGDYILTTFK